MIGEKRKLSSRVSGVTHSATLEINKRVKELQRQGRDVIDLGLGEADYKSPKITQYALFDSNIFNNSRYTECEGTPELRSAISKANRESFYVHDDYKEGLQNDYHENEVLVSTGSKHLLYSALLALCEPGRDEVILHAPYWVSYTDIIKLVGAKQNTIQTTEETNFELRPDVLQESLTENSKVLMLNTPNNPTGQVFSKKNLKGLIDVALENDLFVISDEIYALLTFDDEKHYSLASLGGDEFKEKCIVTSGLSKAYSMGGWRIGYALVKDPEIRQAMTRIGSNTVSSASSIMQDASVHAFKAVNQVTSMKNEFNNRKDYVSKRFKEMNLSFTEPKGAFYIYPNIAEFYGSQYNNKTIANSQDFSEALLEEGVASVPGWAFGSKDNVRFSYVKPLPELREACNRIESFTRQLKPKNALKAPLKN